MNADLLQLKAVAEAATPGPWAQKNKRVPYVWAIGSNEKEHGYLMHQMPIGDDAKDYHPDTRARWLADAAHIAAANPAVVLGLIQQIADLRAALAHPVAVNAAQDWISIHDRLPETEIVDDSECWLSGKRISAAIASQRVLVALIGGGVRVDRLAGLDGNKPYWDTYNLRVTHWMPLPAGPAIDAAMKEKP